MKPINENTCPNCRHDFTTPQGLGLHLKHGCKLSDGRNFTLGKQGMTREEKNKRIAEILGIHWHEWDFYDSPIDGGIIQLCRCCKVSRHSFPNPDFFTDSGAVQLLREIKKQKWYVEFVIWLWDLRDVNMDTYDYITTPGLLAEKLIEWDKMRKEKA